MGPTFNAGFKEGIYFEKGLPTNQELLNISKYAILSRDRR
jgi:hypothetical protein